MWLIIILIAALIVTLFSLYFHNKYELGFLSLMLWGATIMILVDHLFGYKGGKFLEVETNETIQNEIVLGVVMLIPVFFVWFIKLLLNKICIKKESMLINKVCCHSKSKNT